MYTRFFGLFNKVGDPRLALLYASFLFLPAAAIAWIMPQTPEEKAAAPIVGEDEPCT